ncbi:MAG TPA: biotin transporter BioY [Bacteroidota bacterium]|jgi:biotin transport system substrate-specific component
MQPHHDGTVLANPPGTIDSRSTAIQAVLVFAFAAGTAIGAQIELPHQPVPYTLQTFFVLLSAAVLGARKGAVSQLLYLTMGAIGLPVFAHWGAGFAVLAGPTGGYLLSFPLAALVAGWIVRRNGSMFSTVAGMVCGLLVIFSVGTLQLGLLYYHDVAGAIVNGFLIFSWWDLLKLAAAVLVARRWSGGSSRRS